MGISLRRILSAGLSRRTDNTALIRKIGVVYGVDVSHIGSANIVEISKRLPIKSDNFPRIQF
jgi:hypothetical protein